MPPDEIRSFDGIPLGPFRIFSKIRGDTTPKNFPLEMNFSSKMLQEILSEDESRKQYTCICMYCNLWHGRKFRYIHEEVTKTKCHISMQN